MNNGDSAVLTRHVSPAGLLDTTTCWDTTPDEQTQLPAKPRSSEHFHALQSPTKLSFSNSGAGDPAVVGSSCDVDAADAQLDAHPDVSVPSSPRPDTEDAEAAASAAASSVDSPAHFPQKHLPTSPQPPRYPRVEVVIPTGLHARDPPTLDAADNQGPTSVHNCKRHGSPDAEHELSAPPAKQQRVSLRPSTRHNYCQSTVSAVSPPTQIQQQDAAGHARVHDNNIEDRGGEGDNTGFVQTDHEEGAREATQTGHTCLCKAGHTPLPPEEAMTLASAVALELYSLLMRPSTMGTPTAGTGRSGGGSGPPHVGADYAARMSDQGANRARWSEVDNELLLSMRRQNKPWEVIQQRFPNRTPASLRQRYSILNNRSTPGSRGRTRGRRSK